MFCTIVFSGKDTRKSRQKQHDAQRLHVAKSVLKAATPKDAAKILNSNKKNKIYVHRNTKNVKTTFRLPKYTRYFVALAEYVEECTLQGCPLERKDIYKYLRRMANEKRQIGNETDLDKEFYKRYIDLEEEKSSESLCKLVGYYFKLLGKTTRKLTTSQYIPTTWALDIIKCSENILKEFQSCNIY